MDLSLVAPSSKYQESYRGYISELKEAGEQGVPFVLDMPFKDFEGFVTQLLGYSKGENIPEGFVPHSTFWLVENKKEIVGVSNIRHKLTDKLRIEGGHIGYGIRPSRRGKKYGVVILAESLLQAKKLDITQALITCDKDNIFSAKVILKNGGELDSESFVEERNGVVQRYWIQL